MTTLIKNAAGKILKAEGKLWDQNSVEDCDCPCYSVVDCTDATEIQRVNIKSSGKWGIEWELSHPGGNYNYIDAAAYNYTGSFLIEWTDDVVASFSSAGDLLIDNFTTKEVSLQNCIGSRNGIHSYDPTQFYTGQSIISSSAPGMKSRFSTRFWVQSGENIKMTYHTGDGLHLAGSDRYLQTMVYKTRFGTGAVDFDMYTPRCPSSGCCSGGESAIIDTPAALYDWLPTAMGTAGIFYHESPSYLTTIGDFLSDLSLSFTEYDPGFYIEIKGTD